MSIKLRLGQIVPLSLQLEDGEDSLPLVVKATVKKQDGSLYDEVTLTHIGDGLFRSLDISMPNTPELVIQYKVFEEDGIALDPTYSIENDSVFLDDDQARILNTLLSTSILEVTPVYVEQEEEPVPVYVVQEEDAIPVYVEKEN